MNERPLIYSFGHRLVKRKILPSVILSGSREEQFFCLTPLNSIGYKSKAAGVAEIS
jgi:hypothetical protein